ncbi:MAG: hypothetical protein KHX46_09565 [Clostridiales bacterium]|nr:hypothetical protein [Clostridiales bacterium]
MESLVAYLKKAITDKMPLENIVDVFEQMCQTPIEEDMILFETGTYSFAGEPFFYFSLVRQYPNNEDDEFYQIHVDVLYAPTRENAAFESAVWDNQLDENIFDYIRKSPVFAYAKQKEYVQVDISLYEM